MLFPIAGYSQSLARCYCSNNANAYARTCFAFGFESNDGKTAVLIAERNSYDSSLKRYHEIINKQKGRRLAPPLTIFNAKIKALTGDIISFTGWFEN
jgi:hypothetical protein